MLTLRLDSLAAVNWLSGNEQALSALPVPQEHLSFGGCFTSALAHTFNFSSFRTGFVTLTKYELQMGVKIWNNLPCLQGSWSGSTRNCVSYQGWFVYSFHPWHENGRWFNWYIVQDGVVSLALGFFAQNSSFPHACSRACQGVGIAGSFAVCSCLFWDPESELTKRALYVPLQSLDKAGSSTELEDQSSATSLGQCLTVLDASGWVSTAGSPRISVLDSPSSRECAV